jgi:hypothetical protein
LGVESVAYGGKTAGDVPAHEVAWGSVARAAQADNLVLIGWNPASLYDLPGARAVLSSAIPPVRHVGGRGYGKSALSRGFLEAESSTAP